MFKNFLTVVLPYKTSVSAVCKCSDSKFFHLHLFALPTFFFTTIPVLKNEVTSATELHRFDTVALKNKH